MKALLLAAGFGTRLKPLTDCIPKCLAPIQGRPLIDYWLEATFQAGIRRVVVNTHYRADMVRNYLLGSLYAPYIEISYEPELLGTGGTVLKHRELFEAGDVLVAHADNLTDLDIAVFCARSVARPTHCPLAMLTFDAEDPSSCGIVGSDKDSIAIEFHEKVSNPPGILANAAIYVFDRRVTDFLAKLGKEHPDISLDVIPNFLGHIYVVHHTGFHRDIGKIKTWADAQRDFPGGPGAPSNAAGWQELLSAKGHRLSKIINRLINESTIS